MTIKLTLILLAGALFAQDTTVKVQGNGPRGSTAQTNIIFKSALVTFSRGNATIDGTGLATIPISINNRTGQFPAALQFDLQYDASAVASVTFTIGPAAVAASKTITCAAQTTTPPSVRCVISGLNANRIADGVVAQAAVQTSLTSQATTSVVLFGTVTADISGSALRTAIDPNGGTVSMPALLAQVTCAQPDIWTGLVVSCTAALNKPAPTGGAAVALAADSSLVGLPASVSIAAGATTASFNLTGN